MTKKPTRLATLFLLCMIAFSSVAIAPCTCCNAEPAVGQAVAQPVCHTAAVENGSPISHSTCCSACLEANKATISEKIVSDGPPHIRDFVVTPDRLTVVIPSLGTAEVVFSENFNFYPRSNHLLTVQLLL